MTRTTLGTSAAMAIGVSSTMSGVGKRHRPLRWKTLHEQVLAGRERAAEPVSRVVVAPKLPVPVALYWSDIPSSETVPVPRLKISM